MVVHIQVKTYEGGLTVDLWRFSVVVGKKLAVICTKGAFRQRAVPDGNARYRPVPLVV